MSFPVAKDMRHIKAISQKKCIGRRDKFCRSPSPQPITPAVEEFSLVLSLSPRDFTSLKIRSKD